MLGSNDGTSTVSLPRGTVERLGIEKGDNLEIGYYPEKDQFCIRPAEGFEGW